MSFRNQATRAMVVVALVAVGSIGLASPASAHVSVAADKAQAGASDVTVTFDAESESTTAGIVRLQVILPAGIGKEEITWLSGPAHWKLTPTSDGYGVGGPPLPVGMDAVYNVKIAKLPADATALAFETYVSYEDGTMDSWIGGTSADATEPDHPAPVLNVAPAAAGPAQAVSNPAWAGLQTGAVVVVAMTVIIGAVRWTRRRRGGGAEMGPIRR